MTKFVLVRHGEPTYEEVEFQFNKFGIDLAPLTENGIQEVKECAENEIFNGADILISSPYTRAVQTASIIGNRHNLDVNVEVLLHEWRPYLTSDTDTTYIKNLKQVKSEYRLTQNNSNFKTSSKIESLESVRKRGLSVLERYCNYDKVIVVSHKLLISMLFKESIRLNTGEFIVTTSEELKRNFDFHPKSFTKKRF